MKLLSIALIAATLVVLVAVGTWVYFEKFANPRIARELIDEPTGERAEKVMVLTLPSTRQIPVNYLREDAMVYAAADGRWWKELAGDGAGAQVEVLIHGEKMRGRARAILNDADYTTRVFSRLRPNALPGFGTLIEIRLELQ